MDAGTVHLLCKLTERILLAVVICLRGLRRSVRLLATCRRNLCKLVFMLLFTWLLSLAFKAFMALLKKLLFILVDSQLHTRMKVRVRPLNLLRRGLSTFLAS